MADTDTVVPPAPPALAVGDGTIRIVVADITALPVEAFVLYARPDLALGAGFGSAVARRGGQAIKKALDEVGSVVPTEAVVTTGGLLKARYVVHAAGPAFQEPDLESKLRATMARALQRAEERGLRQLAWPAMGAGFHGVPLSTCAAIMVDSLVKYLSAGGRITDLILCANDRREAVAFERQLAATGNAAA